VEPEEESKNNGEYSDGSEDTDMSEVEMTNSVYVSVIQIYNENISDLIQADTKGTN